VKVYNSTGELAQFIGDRGEPSWFASLRNQALEQFKKISWPTLQDEEWRRTDISSFDLDALSFSVPAVAQPRVLSDSDLSSVGYAGKVEFSNGLCISLGLLGDEEKSGVVFTTLQDLLSKDTTGSSKVAKALVRGFEQSLESADNKVFRWSLSAASYGALVYIPKNHRVEKSLRITISASGDDFVTFPFVGVVLEPGAQATIEMAWEGQGGFLVNQSNFFSVGDGANLSYTQIQKTGDEVVVFTNGKSQVERDARFRHFEAILGGGFVKNRIDSSLLGPGSDLELDGIYFADKERHIDLRTVQHHKSHHATSNAVYRGAVADEARVIYQGLIEVSPEAHGTDAYLSNKNLVLNDGAKADSIPSLQINTDDVRCSHGSTTGKLRADQVFYLMTRGYSRSQAQETLILAYFQEVIGRVHESLQDEIYSLLFDQISGIKADLKG